MPKKIRELKAVSMGEPRYTVIIQWSDEDNAYVASLPEWGPYCKTHGATYEEAARNASEVLKTLLDTRDQRADEEMPAPKLFRHPGADVVNLPGEPATLGTVSPSA